MPLWVAITVGVILSAITPIGIPIAIALIVISLTTRKKGEKEK